LEVEVEVEEREASLRLPVWKGDVGRGADGVVRGKTPIGGILPAKGEGRGEVVVEEERGALRLRKTERGTVGEGGWEGAGGVGAGRIGMGVVASCGGGAAVEDEMAHKPEKSQRGQSGKRGIRHRYYHRRQCGRALHSLFVLCER
jgi:hypothetical protein